jgi:hypothetical protein
MFNKIDNSAMIIRIPYLLEPLLLAAVVMSIGLEKRAQSGGDKFGEIKLD